MVISIIGLLASVVVTSLGSARAKARDARRLSDLKQIEIALYMLADSQGGDFFSTGGEARCLGVESGISCWKGGISGDNGLNSALTPYISKIPLDPLYGSRDKGNAYLYTDEKNGVSWHCNNTSYPKGPFLFWLPDGKTEVNSDADCKGLGFYACCGGGVPCTEERFCAYKIQ